MPQIKINGVQLHYETYGTGPQTILFSHGLWWSSQMFKSQVEFFKQNYRCIVYDHRGHGKSQTTWRGYGMKNIYKDTLKLIQHLQLPPFHFVGHAMGSSIGLQLASQHPELLKSLTLLSSSTDAKKMTFENRRLLAYIRIFGVKFMTNTLFNKMFGENFLQNSERDIDCQFWKIQLQQNKRSIIRALKGSFKQKTMTEEELNKITLPTLILSGNQDVIAPPLKSKIIQSMLPNAQFYLLENVGHHPTIENAHQVNQILERFLDM